MQEKGEMRSAGQIEKGDNETKTALLIRPYSCCFCLPFLKIKGTISLYSNGVRI